MIYLKILLWLVIRYTMVQFGTRSWDLASVIQGVDRITLGVTRMRRLGAGSFSLLILLFAVVVSGQAQPHKAATSAPPRAAKPDGNLAQLMRGILFPNSNLLFDVQQNDPGVPKKPDAASSGGASTAYTNVYSGWQVVEGAAVALEESADLILKSGRLCSNGKLAPVARADYVKFAAALREASRQALIAARAKDQMKVSDITNDLADACSMCHEKYRDKGPAGSPERCTP